MAKQLNAGEVKRGDVYYAFPEELVPNDNNSRAFSPNVMNLVDKIVSAGKVHTPLICRQLPDKRVKVVDGEGRREAAIKVNADSLLFEPIRVPIILETLNEEEAFLRSISSNTDRNKTTAVDTAHNIRKLRDTYQKSDDEIVEIYAENGKAKSPAWLSQMAKILTLSSDIQKKLHEGELSADVAFRLADMPEEARDEILELAKQNMAGRKITRTDVNNAARDLGQKVTQARRISDVKKLLATYGGADEPKYQRLFCEKMLTWITGEADDDVMQRAFSRYFRKPEEEEEVTV